MSYGSENRVKHLLNLDNAALKDYKTMEDNCKGNNCCLSSVKYMKKTKGYLLPMGQTCPKDMIRNMLKCKSSYRFCHKTKK